MGRLSHLQCSETSEYSSNKLKRCLEAVESKELGLSAASKLYNIPRSTLWDKIHGRRPKEKLRRGPEARLGIENEKLIEEWAIDMVRRGFPITKPGLLHTVTDIIKKLPVDMREKLDFKDGIPGRGWTNNFLKRHDNIHLRRREYLNWPRENVPEMKIRKWFEETEKLLKDDNVFNALQEPSRIFNVDESALWLNAKDGYYLGEKGKSLGVICKNEDENNVSVCFTISADGSYIPPMGLFKGNRLEQPNVLLAPPNWCVGISESGWMTSESFYEYVANVFVPYLDRKRIPRPVVVFMDGHRSHLSLPLSYFCRHNGIVLVCLPPSATHMMQPLHVSYFKELKNYWRSHLQEMKRCSNEEISKYEILWNLKTVLDKLSRNLEDSAKNGFRRCGLYPWSADNVDYSKCDSFEEDEETPNVPETLTCRETVMSMIEDGIRHIDPTLLAEFRKIGITKTEWSGRLEATDLFHFWQRMHHHEKAFNFVGTSKSTCRNESGFDSLSNFQESDTSEFVETHITEPIISIESSFPTESTYSNNDYFELLPNDPSSINDPLNAAVDHNDCPVTVESESTHRCDMSGMTFNLVVPVIFGNQTFDREEEVVSVPVEDISNVLIEEEVLSVPIEETISSVPVQDASQEIISSLCNSTFPEEVKQIVEKKMSQVLVGLTPKFYPDLTRKRKCNQEPLPTVVSHNLQQQQVEKTVREKIETKKKLKSEQKKLAAQRKKKGKAASKRQKSPLSCKTNV